LEELNYNYNYMNITNTLLLLCLVCILIYPCFNEGYINRPLKDEPDDIQFYACHGKDTIKYKGEDKNITGYNNYKLKKHGIGLPLQGVYSHFLDTYKIRNYDEIFHAPICENEPGSFESNDSFKDISNLEHPEIFEFKDLSKSKEMLEKEKYYEEHSTKEPNYKYVDPNYIANKLTYSDEINELFLKTHHAHDEGVLHHRIDDRILDK